MNRPSGSSRPAPKSVTRLLGAIAVSSLGAITVLLLQPAAHADSATVPLGKSSYTTPIGIQAGGDVTFTAIPTQGANLLLYTGMYLSGPGASNYFIKAGDAMPPITFPSAGDANYTWKPKCTCGVHAWTVTIRVSPAPPPPDSSTPADPSSSDPGGGSTGPGNPSGTGTQTGTPTGTATGTATATGVPTGAGTSGGGISIGSGGVIDNNNPLPIGFNAPPPDPNQPTPTIPNAIGTGVGVVPTGAVSSDSTSASSSQTLVELANSKPVGKSRPTSLAIISIAVLAIVSSVYAYRRLGEAAQRPLH